MSEAARRRRVLRRTFGVLVGLLLGLAAAEVAVRVRYPVLNLRRDFEPGIYVEDPARGYANQANYVGVFKTYFEDTPVRTNSLGFRGAEPPADVEGALRVLCLGDSNMFGQGVGDDETLPAQLERLLRARGPAVVYNAGVSGYATEHELRTLKVFGPRLRPQVVVLGWLDNDLEGPDLQVGHGHLVERAEDKDKVKKELKARWYEASHLGRLLSIGVRTARHHSRTSARAAEQEAVPEEALATCLALLREVQAECERLGARLVVVAYVGQPEVEAGARSAVVDAFVAGARAAGVDVLESYGPLREEFERSGRALFAPRDRVHPSAAGHEVIAKALAEKLAAR
ncbi:MAG: GDSL-type esterase/lipase family protein [Planctomycetes bacterium]|nr:GDSL-type esterase/lipase family protein [Planctomycetota bacterium]